MNKLKVSYEIKMLIESTCLEYKKEFKKHRKEVSHFSKGGLYQEWEKNRYRSEENERN